MSTKARLLVVAILGLAFSGAAVRADTYALDPYHSSITFMIQHLGISYIHGRFNEMAGEFNIDKDASKSTFALSIKADSVDTNMKKRDDHLRSPDYFNTKQYPLITFQSTSVKPAEGGGYQVSGDFTMHGVTKAVTMNLKGGKTIELKGMQRTGYYTVLPLRRSEFGMATALDMLGDEVHIYIGMEGLKK